MPPKKKKKEKESKDAKEAEGEEGAPTEPNDEVVEKKREVDILELLYSSEAELQRVQTLELESVTMRTIARELRMRLDRHLQSQTQIISHLNLEIMKKDAKIEDLTEIKQELEEVKKVMMDKNAEEVEKQQAEHEDESKQLSTKIGELRTEYRSMDDLLRAKLKLEEELEEVVAELETEKRDHTVLVGELERRNVMEKERLKYEMLRKIRETKLSLLDMTEDQLHTTTKRTIMENEQMTTELQYQSKETERKVKLNNKLLKENKAMRRQMELHEQSQTMLVKRTKKFQNVIKSLNDDLAKQHKESQVARQSRFSTDPTKAMIETKEIITSLEQRSFDLEELVRAAQEETQLARNQLDDTRKATARMLGVQNESLSFTLMCFEHVKLGFAKQRMEALDREALHGVQLPAISNSRDSSREPSREVVPRVMPGDFDLDNLTTPETREGFLEALIERFNSFGPEQTALLTQV